MVVKYTFYHHQKRMVTFHEGEKKIYNDCIALFFVFIYEGEKNQCKNVLLLRDKLS